MITDPSLCPIPPGFVVHGGFNDSFFHFKDTTPYDHWYDASGVDHGENDGVSKRWKNPTLRSVNLLCGFQFKIGPDPGIRWKDPIFGGKETIGTVSGGDISVHFPRRDGPDGDRGGYLVLLKWFLECTTDDGRIGGQVLSKEIPHGDYAGDHGWGGEFNIYHPRHLDRINIKDGQWHSFLAVCYNAYHRIDSQTDGFFPTIRLYYSHTPTTRFEDFMLLGWGVDTNIPPRGPLVSELGEADNILEDLWGDSLFTPEHVLQIRIDDVPLNQIEIRNVYSASVGYGGITPPQNPPFCQAEANAILERQPPVSAKRAEIDEVKALLETAADSEIPSIKRTLIRLRSELRPLLADLRAAEFSYEICVEKTLHPPPPPICPSGQHWDVPQCQCVPDVVTPMVKVPDFISTQNVHPDSAERELRELGLVPRIQGCRHENCIVKDQNPAPFKEVPKGSTVVCHSVDATQ